VVRFREMEDAVPTEASLACIVGALYKARD